jgi:hypothetical protein
VGCGLGDLLSDVVTSGGGSFFGRRPRFINGGLSDNFGLFTCDKSRLFGGSREGRCLYFF